MQQEPSSVNKEYIERRENKMKYEAPIAKIYELEADVIATSTSTGGDNNTTPDDEL